MGALLGLMKVLAVPLMILNMLGGIVSGIWLAILGEWGAIGYGIAALVISGLALSLVLMPGLLLAAPAAYFGEKNMKAGVYFFGFLSSLYTVGVITVWCVAVLFFFTKKADSSSIIPMLIWSYGVATGPWAWMAQKEQQGGDGFASIVATFFSQVGYIVMIVMVLFFRVTLMDVFIAFGVVMLVSLVLQFITALQVEREMGGQSW